MSVEIWRKRYAHLLDEVRLEHNYSDEAQQEDYAVLSEHLDQDELGGKHGAKAFFSRPQIRKNDAPRTVSRTVPMWFFNDAAVRLFLMIQFPKIVKVETQKHAHSPRNGCHCAGCRDLRGALLWNYVIRRLRRNESAEEIASGWAPEPKKAMAPKTTRLDVSRTDAHYWEGVLKSFEEPRVTIHDSDDAVSLTNGVFEPVPFECPQGRPITARDVRRTLQQIRFVASGLRTDGKRRQSPDVVEDKGLSS